MAVRVLLVQAVELLVVVEIVQNLKKRGMMIEESRIKFEVRTKLGQSLSDFAENNNISRTTVSLWSNKKKVISPRHVKKLKALGISQAAIEKPWEKV